ncbi:MAG: ABC transporter substrate-binding protein [Caldilineaceae bacterium]
MSLAAPKAARSLCLQLVHKVSRRGVFQAGSRDHKTGRPARQDHWHSGAFWRLLCGAARRARGRWPDRAGRNLDSIGFTQAAALSQGQVDAAVDYAVNGPVVLAQQGITTTEIALDPFLTVPANGLVTNEKTIKDNPDLVARMAQAMQRSIAYTLANPDEAFASALKFVPEAGGDNTAANRAVFDASLPYWTPQPGTQPGATTEAAWGTAAEFMQRIGLVDVLVPAADLFTNQFVES